MAAAMPEPASPRLRWPLLLACPVLALAGALSHHVALALLALALFVTLAMLPALARGRPAPWLAWLGVQVVLAVVAGLGFAELLLESVPVAVNAGLAWLFARTAARPRPLIACCIVAVEGEARLREPGVARYARRLTVLWAVLLAANALLLGWLLVCVPHVGVLARLGLDPALRLDAWATIWLEVGGYTLPVVLFVLEYGYRRWRWRHLQHPGLAQMLLRLVAQWPRLLHDQVAPE
jgi:uncharacterized membrane protein